MVVTASTNYAQACLDTSFNCKNLLTELGRNNKILPSQKAKLLNDCANVCLGTYQAIKNRSINAALLSLLCMGICEECADFCDSINNSLFKQCADACRNCSDNLGNLAITAIT